MVLWEAKTVCSFIKKGKFFLKLSNILTIDEQPQQIRNFENQQKVDAEYNVWTRNDCQGTQYSNGNRYIYLSLK